MNGVSHGASTERKSAAVSLLNLATVGVVVAWLAFACYAVAYLVSH